MVSDRWDDQVFDELHRLGTMLRSIDSGGDVHIMPELRVVLESDGKTARVMDNRHKKFICRLPAEKVLMIMRTLSAVVGTDVTIGALVSAAEGGEWPEG